MGIKTFAIKIFYLKKRRKLAKQFPNSRINYTTILNNETKLEGYNVIYSHCNLCDTSVGICTSIGHNNYLANCSIGKFCSIASNVSVQPYTHPIDFISTYPGFFNTKSDLPFGRGTRDFDEKIMCSDGKAVNIGNDVWIGQNVIIKGGITIGDGAIIGMGAVVTKDVPPYAIVGGVPAKIIRYRFDQKEIERLLELQWWDWPIEKIKSNSQLFTDKNAFFELFCK